MRRAPRGTTAWTSSRGFSYWKTRRARSPAGRDPSAITRPRLSDLLPEELRSRAQPKPVETHVPQPALAFCAAREGGAEPRRGRIDCRRSPCRQRPSPPYGPRVHRGHRPVLAFVAECLDGSRTHGVPDPRRRLVARRPARLPHPPRDVDVLGVHPLGIVETPDRVPRRPASEQEGAMRPVDAARAFGVPLTHHAKALRERRRYAVDAAALEK